MLKFYLFLPYIREVEEETFSTVVILSYDVQKNLKNRYLKLDESTQTQLSCATFSPSCQVSKATAMPDTWKKAARNLGESSYRIYHCVDFFPTLIK